MLGRNVMGMILQNIIIHLRDHDMQEVLFVEKTSFLLCKTF